MKGAFVTVALVIGVLAAGDPLSAAGQQDLPRFRSSVDLTSVDVSVFDNRGRPVTDLKPEEFDVRIDGARRRVVSAEWVPLETPERPAAPPPPEGYTSNESATGGRLILTVVDELNIRAGGTLGIRNAVNAFLDKLQPSDRIAVVGIGQGAPSTPFTADRERLKNALVRMIGQRRTTFGSEYNVSLAEALDIDRNMPGVLESVVARECAGLRFPDNEQCAGGVRAQADITARDGMLDGAQTITALRSLLIALRRIDAPKTLLFISEGFVLGDNAGAVVELGALSAAARTSMYSLKLDDQLFAASAEVRSPSMTQFGDRMARAEGLELLAGAARGSLFNITGTGAGVFDRLATELSGYYLLGVESGATDKDGKTHPIRVEVTRQGITIRARRALLATREDLKPRNAREAVMAALATPLPVSALPMRVASFSLQGPEAQKVQLLIHADIGVDYSSSRVVSLGYIISDGEGRIVDSQAGDARLPPIMNGVPSALQFSGGASLAPGDYLLKLAVVEGDRVGTVEHTIHAGLVPAGPVKVSDLMVGGPTSDAELLQPTVGHTVVFGTLHGYVEVYGSDSRGLKARYDIVPDPQGDPLLSDDAPARPAGESRTIFSRMMPVRQLPPGQYFLRVTLSAGGSPVKTLIRGFEVAAPAVLMTSAKPGDLSMPTDVFLSVTDQMLSRPFVMSELSKPETLRTFRGRVSSGARDAFDKGVALLTAGQYSKAEDTFKAAIDTDAESTAVLAYLAACFAAAGHDLEAASAWQTALIEGSDLPQIYEWLSDALMRNRDLSQARAVLEEATAKWPADPRFARPMAMIYATFGQGREAVRSLERHLAEHPTDADASFL